MTTPRFDRSVSPVAVAEETRDYGVTLATMVVCLSVGLLLTLFLLRSMGQLFLFPYFSLAKIYVLAQDLSRKYYYLNFSSRSVVWRGLGGESLHRLLLLL